MRSYETMRHVLAVAAKTEAELHYVDFRTTAGRDDDMLECELNRLKREDLLDGEVNLTHEFGERSCCRVAGLTDEGLAFYKLIENDKVWDIILETLKAANIDISYSLLKEVCEEIVKRYVTSCIPDIKPCK